MADDSKQNILLFPDTITSPFTDEEYDFFERELEVPARLLAAHYSKTATIKKWVKGLTTLEKAVLHTILNRGSISWKPTHLLRYHRYLFPFCLLSHFYRYKEPLAIQEVAEAHLSSDILMQCQKPDGSYAKKALLFYLWKQDPLLIKHICHLNYMHKKGYARMRLANTYRQLSLSLNDYLTEERIVSLLYDFDARLDDNKVSEYKGKMILGDRLYLFVTRGAKESKIALERTIIHGFAVQWMVLDFAFSAQKVNISGSTHLLPLQLANYLATAYFNHPCLYENDYAVTYEAQLGRLVEHLRHQQDPNLQLFKVNAYGPGGGLITLSPSHNDHSSLQDLLGILARGGMDLLKEIRYIDYLVILFKEHKITLTWEQLPQSGKHLLYTVRYTDRALNAKYKQHFERHMKHHYGITVFSTQVYEQPRAV